MPYKLALIFKDGSDVSPRNIKERHSTISSSCHYLPQQELRKDNVLPSVCQEFCPQGRVSSSRSRGCSPPGRHPMPDTPLSQTPPLQQTLALGRHPLGRHPHGQTPPWADTPWADIPLGRHSLGRQLPSGRHTP